MAGTAETTELNYLVGNICLADKNDQIRLLLNIRQDIRVLLASHPKGIWYRMLPKVYYMHFNRPIRLDMFSIANPLLFLDYISDIIKFDFPDNVNEEDFIIELKNEPEKALHTSMQLQDFELRRNVLLQMLKNTNIEKQGPVLREICIIDEYLKCIKDEEDNVTSTQVPSHEQICLRLQKLRAMIDCTLRYLLKKPNSITDDELIELGDDSDEFIRNLTPLAQRLSSLND